jgi:uncharacterized membrane protein
MGIRRDVPAVAGQVTAEGWLVSALLAATAAVVVGTALLVTAAIAAGASEWWQLPFRLLCHGLAERSFELGGAVMPICARCTAIWSGLLFGSLTVLPFLRRGWRIRLDILLLLVSPLLIDGLTQAFGWRESTNMLRALTGFVAGSSLAWWALPEVQRIGVENLKRLKFETVTREAGGP